MMNANEFIERVKIMIKTNASTGTIENYICNAFAHDVISSRTFELASGILYDSLENGRPTKF